MHSKHNVLMSRLLNLCNHSNEERRSHQQRARSLQSTTTNTRRHRVTVRHASEVDAVHGTASMPSIKAHLVALRGRHHDPKSVPRHPLEQQRETRTGIRRLARLSLRASTLACSPHATTASHKAPPARTDSRRRHHHSPHATSTHTKPETTWNTPTRPQETEIDDGRPERLSASHRGIRSAGCSPPTRLQVRRAPQSTPHRSQQFSSNPIRSARIAEGVPLALPPAPPHHPSSRTHLVQYNPSLPRPDTVI